jgi:imidazolonepropionase
MKVFIKNIKGLVGVHDVKVNVLKGAAMQSLPVLENAWIALEDGMIADFGEMTDWPGITDWRDLEVIDASGKYVLPTWVDSHTHVVFAGSREGEFADRIAGLTYEQIAARGGGIINSVAKLRNTSEDELFENAFVRLNDMMMMGTGAVEIKSGYGLNVESELKILRVIRRLKNEHPLLIKATFLGAHAYPSEFKENKEGYLDLLLNEMIPEVAKQGLADFIDVFCELNYFSTEDTARILDCGARYGLIPKVHVNQFNSIGGIQTCVEHHARSVDHLEVLTDADIAALQNSDTIPVALPGCSLFIKIPYTPARRIIDAGLPLALATDYNPGSAPSGNMNLVNSLACIQMNMTVEETINASTINAAFAMDISEHCGSIARGKLANLFITREISSLATLPYSFGLPLIETVIIGGEIRS